jgi:hypothetical protein
MNDRIAQVRDIEYAQVDETGLSDVCRDELGGHLDGCQEQREVACRSVTKPDLIMQNMSELR